MSGSKNYVFISWKDIKNPKAGGSEIVHQEISKRLVRDGHKVTHLVPGFVGAAASEEVDGVKIIRLGSSLFSFWNTTFYYRRHLRDTTDILVDVFNCFGSFAWIIGAREKTVFFIHHVQGRIWLYQTVFPFIPPFNLVGWLLEVLQLHVTGYFGKLRAITVSASTKRDLIRRGFAGKDIHVIRQGSDIPHVENLVSLQKEEVFTVLFFGRLVRMKNPLVVLKAFKKFHQKHPQSQLWIAGSDGADGTFEKMYTYLKKHNLYHCTQFFGRVSQEQKLDLMKKAHVITVTSVKEGWGLIVTEANSQGTPAVTFNVPGLRDSNKYGLLTKTNSVTGLVEALEEVYLDKRRYVELQHNSYLDSKQYVFENSYEDFVRFVEADSKR